MAQYLLSVWGGDQSPYASDEEMKAAYASTGVFNEQLQQSGAWVFAGGLEPSTTATVVDGRGAEVTTTDGPFVESKEHLGGFWVVDVPDLDAAMALAAKGSKACGNPVEVRPFQSM